MKSRIAGRIVAVVAAVVASCCFITPAFAGNVGKTSWSAYLTGWNTADTPNRQKQNASNGYIKADHVSGGGRYVRGCLDMQMKMWNLVS